MRSAACGTPPL